MIEWDTVFLAAVLAGAIRAGTPIVFAALGELIYERAGILNLAVEGMMLCGALCSVAVQVAYGSVFLSLAAAALAGAMFGVTHALLCAGLRTNQIATGLALVFLAQGVTAFFGRGLVGRRVVASLQFDVPLLSGVPVLGPGLFQHDVLVYAVLPTVVVVWWVLFRTRWGVTLRAVGEDASAAASHGVPVLRVRLLAASACGALCAVGGAHLALIYASQWQENMTAGRGWIALVLVIVSTWRPALVPVFGYLFGGLSALQLNLQAAGIRTSSYVLGMIPFLLSIVVLVIVNTAMRSRILTVPAELTRPSYRPGD